MNKLVKVIYDSDISGIIGEIEETLIDHDLYTIDEMLGELDETKLSTQACISVIRCTFRIRNMINNWYDFRRRLHTEIYTRGENPDRLMRGLYEN